jgi:hypothetical protein
MRDQCQHRKEGHENRRCLDGRTDGIVRAPGTIAAYRKNGHFPDGTILVKEVFKTTTPTAIGFWRRSASDRRIAFYQHRQETP